MTTPENPYYNLYQRSSYLSLSLYLVCRAGSDRDRIGVALIDALDGLISEGRITPQLAIKIVNNFDKHVAVVLSEKVKANLTFKVCPWRGFVGHSGRLRGTDRATSVHTTFAMMCGVSSSKMSPSNFSIRAKIYPA
jgi:hypothetical protein